MPTISEALNIAIQHHNRGELPQAEQIYRQILAVQPNHADATHLLGVMAQQVGQHELAVELIGKAVGLNGNSAIYQNNLGEAYRALSKFPESVACYRRALEIKPDFAEVHNNLGNALKELKQVVEATACYKRALQIKPYLPEAHNNLGLVHSEQMKLDEAAAYFRRAIEFKPNYAEAYRNLGLVHNAFGKTSEAIACFHQALAARPHYPDVYNCLGNALKEQGKLNEAVANYRRSVELEPNNPDVYHNLAIMLCDQGDFQQGVQCYQRAHELKPDVPATLANLVHGLQHQCKWDELSTLSPRLLEMLARDDSDPPPVPAAPFALIALTIPTTPAQQLTCAQKMVQHELKAVSGVADSIVRVPRSTVPRKLRVGYLSGDFRVHPVAFLVAELFEKHARDRFEFMGYSYGIDDGSAIRQRIAASFDRFVDLRDESYLEAARRIAADDVDILVDLTAYTSDARTKIVALRPAPIQVNYLGYPGTMGAPFMDYIFVDQYIVPPEQQPFYTEKLVHLPGCYQVNDSHREIAAETPSREECGLPETGLVFCSFNNNYKITPDMFDVWMQLLREVPGSVLWLIESNRFVADNLRREAEKRGVDGARLVFAPRKDLPEHMARHRLVDLFIDTFPYNAHTTASDALWAGCPVLTLSGETFASRVAGSILQTIGLPELITTSREEYLALALRLARDAELLKGYRDRIKANRATSPLFDAERFARNLEAAYQKMWDLHVAGEQPQAFAVSEP